MAYSRPSSRAADAATTGSSIYIVIADTVPMVIGSDRESMNRGFTPRGRLPKFNDALNEDIRHVTARERAMPPPMSFP